MVLTWGTILCIVCLMVTLIRIRLGAYFFQTTKRPSITTKESPLEQFLRSVSLKKLSGKIVVSRALFIYLRGHMVMYPSTRFADPSGGPVVTVCGGPWESVWGNKINPRGCGSGQQVRSLLIKCQLPRWMWFITLRRPPTTIHHMTSSRRLNPGLPTTHNVSGWMDMTVNFRLFRGCHYPLLVWLCVWSVSLWTPSGHFIYWFVVCWQTVTSPHHYSFSSSLISDLAVFYS